MLSLILLNFFIVCITSLRIFSLTLTCKLGHLFMVMLDLELRKVNTFFVAMESTLLLRFRALEIALAPFLTFGTTLFVSKNASSSPQVSSTQKQLPDLPNLQSDKSTNMTQDFSIQEIQSTEIRKEKATELTSFCKSLERLRHYVVLNYSAVYKVVVLS